MVILLYKYNHWLLYAMSKAESRGDGDFMPTILVDYENVNGSNGLKGADALQSEDTLIIFYSRCCAKIRYDFMQEIREKLWKEAFWSQSFCLLTAGGAPVEVIRQYIETQGEKRH